jgi:hypothetical protein
VIVEKWVEVNELANQDSSRQELRQWCEFGLAPAGDGLEDACRSGIYRLAAITRRMMMAFMLTLGWLIAIEKMMDSMRRRINQERKKQRADRKKKRAAQPGNILLCFHGRVPDDYIPIDSAKQAVMA